MNLVDHNLTTTGFGIASWVKDGVRYIQAISPCCGKFIDRADGCDGCGETYHTFSSTATININSPLDISAYGGVDHIIEGWAQRLTGEATLKLEVNR